MILEGERSGRLYPGKVILDATSGNTGIAYAMLGAARGYAVTLCLPANASEERKRILRIHGAEIIETDPLQGSDGAQLVAREMAERDGADRKSTRLNSSHTVISYAVFCLKKKTLIHNSKHRL